MSSQSVTELASRVIAEGPAAVTEFARSGANACEVFAVLDSLLERPDLLENKGYDRWAFVCGLAVAFEVVDLERFARYLDASGRHKSSLPKSRLKERDTLTKRHLTLGKARAALEAGKLAALKPAELAVLSASTSGIVDLWPIATRAPCEVFAFSTNSSLRDPAILHFDGQTWSPTLMHVSRQPPESVGICQDAVAHRASPKKLSFARRHGTAFILKSRDYGKPWWVQGDEESITNLVMVLKGSKVLGRPVDATEDTKDGALLLYLYGTETEAAVLARRGALVIWAEPWTSSLDIAKPLAEWLETAEECWVEKLREGTLLPNPVSFPQLHLKLQAKEMASVAAAETELRAKELQLYAKGFGAREGIPIGNAGPGTLSGKTASTIKKTATKARKRKKDKGPEKPGSTDERQRTIEEALGRPISKMTSSQWTKALSGLASTSPHLAILAVEHLMDHPTDKAPTNAKLYGFGVELACVVLDKTRAEQYFVAMKATRKATAKRTKQLTDAIANLPEDAKLFEQATSKLARGKGTTLTNKEATQFVHTSSGRSDLEPLFIEEASGCILAVVSRNTFVRETEPGSTEFLWFYDGKKWGPAPVGTRYDCNLANEPSWSAVELIAGKTPYEQVVFRAGKHSFRTAQRFGCNIRWYTTRYNPDRSEQDIDRRFWIRCPNNQWAERIMSMIRLSSTHGRLLVNPYTDERSHQAIQHIYFRPEPRASATLGLVGDVIIDTDYAVDYLRLQDHLEECSEANRPLDWVDQSLSGDVHIDGPAMGKPKSKLVITLPECIQMDPELARPHLAQREQELWNAGYRLWEFEVLPLPSPKR